MHEINARLVWNPIQVRPFWNPPPPKKKMWWFQSKRDLLCRVRSSRFADRVLFRFVFQSRRGWRRRLPRWQKCKKEKRRRSRMRRRRRRRRRRGNDEKTRRKTRSHDHDRHPSGNQTPALFYLVVDATSSDFRFTAGITTDRSLLTKFFWKKTNKQNNKNDRNKKESTPPLFIFTNASFYLVDSSSLRENWQRGVLGRDRRHDMQMRWSETCKWDGANRIGRRPLFAGNRKICWRGGGQKGKLHQELPSKLNLTR